MSDSSILDSEAIENLRALGDEMEDDSFLKEVIEIYLSDTPTVSLKSMNVSYRAMPLSSTGPLTASRDLPPT